MEDGGWRWRMEEDDLLLGPLDSQDTVAGRQLDGDDGALVSSPQAGRGIQYFYGQDTFKRAG